MVISFTIVKLKVGPKSKLNTKKFHFCPHQIILKADGSPRCTITYLMQSISTYLNLKTIFLMSN